MAPRNESEKIAREDALRGRPVAMTVAETHAVLGTPMQPPFAPGTEAAIFGLGCFWGAEKRFWELDGVHTTQVGYSGGYTRNPLYEEVCTGKTGHAEVVRVIFHPERTSFLDLLRIFWESHDPTQGMRQGNDVGSQYRSAVFHTSETQRQQAVASRDAYQTRMVEEGFGRITTEIEPAGEFYYAEDYHQQYLEKNPLGYCGLGGTGVTCPIGLISAD